MTKELTDNEITNIREVANIICKNFSIHGIRWVSVDFAVGAYACKLHNAGDDIFLVYPSVVEGIIVGNQKNVI